MLKIAKNPRYQREKENPIERENKAFNYGH